MVGVVSGSLHAGGLTARVVWPGLSVGGRLNRVNSRSGFELR